MVRQIRTIDTKHTIIVGPANWNSYRSLSAMPIYEDENLMYTFHFYNPFIFTHQGASWVQPSMEDISIEDYTEQTIQCFPNPFSDSIEIRSAIEGKHDYKLYNTSGDLVSKNSFITDFRLSTASLPAGLYILKVETPGFQSFTKQLIKN